MLTLRQIVPGLCVASAVLASALAVPAVSAVYAAGSPAPAAADALDAVDAAGAPDSVGPPDAPNTAGWCHGARGGGEFGPMGHLLHQLNLTADQKTQIKSILAGQKSQFEALRESSKKNRLALASTPPSNPSYPALIQAAQTNAVTRVTLMSNTWKQIYESVLTKAQREQIPSIAAAAEQARESRMAKWKAAQSRAQ